MDDAKDGAPNGGSFEVEAAFDRLQQLYDRLAAMEARGALLARAKAAAEILRIERELATARTLLAEAEARESEAREAFDRAVRGAGGECDGADIDERRRALLHAGSLRGFRIGPAQNAQAELVQALDEGPFASVAEARAAALNAGELAALEADVEAYRSAYAAALALCERLAPSDCGA